MCVPGGRRIDAIDALVAAPFQEAMSTLVQALLSGIRGGLGFNTATATGGALRAAKWVRGRSAGLYDMTDVLGLASR